jgi:trk system potassium uptake protein TrkA
MDNKQKKQTFAVIGLGSFGIAAASELGEKGADVIVLDHRQELIDQVRNRVSRAICGDATNEDVLRASGILDADVVIVAIRDYFETAVLVTTLLTDIENMKVYVQVNSDREKRAIERLGATRAVFPDCEMANELVRTLLHPNLQDFIPIGEDFGIIEEDVPDTFAGKTLIDLDVRRRFHVTIVALKRTIRRKLRHEQLIVENKPDEPLEKDDILIAVGNTERLARFRKAMEEARKDEKPENGKSAAEPKK